MGYDNMYNITSKVQHITQKGVQFSGTLQAGYNLGYTIADNCQQIANIADTTYRTEGTGTVVPEYKVSQFSYDANGNLLSINTGTKQGDKLLAANSRKMLWDEENRMLATNDNGYVTSYWYDDAWPSNQVQTTRNGGSNSLTLEVFIAKFLFCCFCFHSTA